MEGNKIKFSKRFRTFEDEYWIGVDIVVNDGEDWDKKWKEAKERVNRYGMDANGIAPMMRDQDRSLFESLKQANSSPIPSIDYKAKDEKVKKIEKSIENAGSQEELKQYQDEAIKYDLVKQYINKFQSLK